MCHNKWPYQGMFKWGADLSLSHPHVWFNVRSYAMFPHVVTTSIVAESLACSSDLGYPSRRKSDIKASLARLALVGIFWGSAGPVEFLPVEKDFQRK